MCAAALAFLEPCELASDAVEVARISDAWGIQGSFKVLPHSASPEALFSCKQWILLPPEPRSGVLQKPPPFSTPQVLRLRQAKEHGASIVATAHDCTDRTSAELLKGCRVFVPRSAFPTPAQDEFYWVDLIGCSVSNLQAESIGIVKDLMSTGPQTVIVVQREQEGKALETLIPFVAAYVSQVSIAEKCITVDWQLDY